MAAHTPTLSMKQGGSQVVRCGTFGAGHSLLSVLTLDSHIIWVTVKCQVSTVRVPRTIVRFTVQYACTALR